MAVLTLYCELLNTWKYSIYINSLWPGDTIWQHWSVSILAQVMACCLMAPSHHHIQCWFVMSSVQWHQSHYLSQISLKSPRGPWVNSLGPSDAIWHWRSWSTLVQVMACCLMAPSHYLNQCWLIISQVLWHSSEDIIIRRFEDTNQCDWYGKARLKITFLKSH